MVIERTDPLGLEKATALRKSVAKGLFNLPGFEIQDPTLLLDQPSIRVGVNQSAAITQASPVFHKFSKTSTNRLNVPHLNQELYDQLATFKSCTKVLKRKEALLMTGTGSLGRPDSFL